MLGIRRLFRFRVARSDRAAAAAGTSARAVVRLAVLFALPAACGHNWTAADGADQGDQGDQAADAHEDLPDPGETLDGEAAGEAGPDDVAGEEYVRPDVAGSNPQVCGDGLPYAPEECDDGNATRGDGCEPDCTFSCRSNAACDDGNPCTIDTCDVVETGRVCRATINAGGGCDDGNPCTVGDSCLGDGSCQPGGNECPCDRDAICGAFDDADPCNGSLRCGDGFCAVDPLTIVRCDPSFDTACRRSVCNPATGTCVLTDVSDGSPCRDGDWCTVVDECRLGECLGDVERCLLDCNVCEAAEAQCEAAPGYCIVDDACVAEGQLAPGNPCLLCDPTASAWAWAPAYPGTSCDDGLFCNGRETCDGLGACVPGPDPCPIDGCIGGCDEASATCRPAAAGTVCRSAAGSCDLEEACDGLATTCPPDAFASAGTICRAAAHDCDVGEACTGTGPTCPTNVGRPDATACGPTAAGLCCGGTCFDPGECCDNSQCAGRSDVDRCDAPTHRCICNREGGACPAAAPYCCSPPGRCEADPC